MSPPTRCPYCHADNIRPLNAEVADLNGYRCNVCERTFYVAAIQAEADHSTPTEAPHPKPMK